MACVEFAGAQTEEQSCSEEKEEEEDEPVTAALLHDEYKCIFTSSNLILHCNRWVCNRDKSVFA